MKFRDLFEIVDQYYGKKISHVEFFSAKLQTTEVSKRLELFPVKAS